MCSRAMQRRLDRTPEASKLRRQTVEHPFATLKGLDGSDALLDQNTAEGQNGDELCNVLAYNMKRAMNLLGTKVLLRAIAA